MDFEVIVQLKGEVLDPEGRAIQETLVRQGISGVTGVHVSKRYLLTITDQSEQQAVETARKIAETYLANPVAETYSLRGLS